MFVADTHIIIWDALKQDKLSVMAREALDMADRSDGIVLCDISFWEIAMLVAKKRVEIGVSYLDFIDLVLTARNITVQPITPRIADIVTTLPEEITYDPADRLIAATALSLGIPLITADKNLADSEVVQTVW
jgi:PIN domain nuclease of toxin-antitoxin system